MRTVSSYTHSAHRTTMTKIKEMTGVFGSWVAKLESREKCKLKIVLGIVRVHYKNKSGEDPLVKEGEEIVVEDGDTVYWTEKCEAEWI